MNQQIKDSIIRTINSTQGINYQILEANLLCEFLFIPADEIHSTIEGMIIDHEIVEIQYEIPGYGMHSYLVPKESKVRA